MIILCCGIAFSGCYKDEADLTVLNTNPYDPDYEGDDFLILDGSRVITVPTGRKLFLEFHVDTNKFEELVPYSIRVKDLSEDFVININETPDHNYVHEKVPVSLGVQYCFEVAIDVNESLTRTSTFCVTAE